MKNNNNFGEEYIPPRKFILLPIIFIVIFFCIFTFLIFADKDIETEKVRGHITGWDVFYTETYIEYEVDGVTYEGKLDYYSEADYRYKPVVVEYEKGNPEHLVTTSNLKVTYIIFDVILVLALIGLIIYAIKFNSPPDIHKPKQTKKPQS